MGSSEDFVLYEYKPFTNEYTHYFVGNDTYMNNYCWPGDAIFYSYFMEFPDNFFWAIMNIYFEITTGWTSAYLSIPQNNKAY